MTDERKIDFLDDFAPQIENVELKFWSNCERMESMVGLI